MRAILMILLITSILIISGCELIESRNSQEKDTANPEYDDSEDLSGEIDEENRASYNREGPLP
jgi:hypothetical protein